MGYLIIWHIVYQCKGAECPSIETLYVDCLTKDATL